MLLRHLGEPEVAQRIEDAVFVTLEEGEAVTLDVARQSGDVEHATSTSGFADAIIGNLGRSPSVRYARKSQGAPAAAPEPRPRWQPRSVGGDDIRLVGVDVYTEQDGEAAVVGRALEEAAGPEFRLLFVSARGTVVYPTDNANIDTVGWWRCRFVPAKEGAAVDDAAILRLLARIGERMPWVHVQKLRTYGDEEGYTRAQGQ
jgi:isocitrate dehydrogenase